MDGQYLIQSCGEDDLMLLNIESNEAADANIPLRERIGCFISEVTVPGWTPEQHQFVDEEKLKAMWNGQSGWEQYMKFTKSLE